MVHVWAKSSYDFMIQANPYLKGVMISKVHNAPVKLFCLHPPPGQPLGLEKNLREKKGGAL